MELVQVFGPINCIYGCRHQGVLSQVQRRHPGIEFAQSCGSVQHHSHYKKDSGQHSYALATYWVMGSRRHPAHFDLGCAGLDQPTAAIVVLEERIAGHWCFVV